MIVAECTIIRLHGNSCGNLYLTVFSMTMVKLCVALYRDLHLGLQVNLFESSCTARPTPYPLPRVVLHGEPVDRAAAARMDLALDEREDARIVRRLV